MNKLEDARVSLSWGEEGGERGGGGGAGALVAEDGEEGAERGVGGGCGPRAVAGARHVREDADAVCAGHDAQCGECERAAPCSSSLGGHGAQVRARELGEGDAAQLAPDAVAVVVHAQARVRGVRAVEEVPQQPRKERAKQEPQPQSKQAPWS